MPSWSLILGGLRSHRDFRRLWAAQAGSALGARVTRTGLPVIAVLSAFATPLQVALLSVVGVAPGALAAFLAVTLRQTVVQDHLLARANALFTVARGTLIPLGAVGAGLLAQLASVRSIFWLGTSAGLAAPLFLIPLLSDRTATR